MATYFSLKNGLLSDPSTYGLSLSSVEKTNNTTGYMLLTSDSWSTVLSSSSADVIDSIAVHLSSRAASPIGVLSAQVSQYAGLVTRSNVTLSADSPFGTGVDGSISFNSANSSYVSVPAGSDINFGSGDFTIEMWLKTTDFTLDTANRTVLSFGTGAANKLMLVFGTGTIGSGTSSGTTSKLNVFSNVYLINGTIDVADGNWNHVCLLRTGNSLRLYVNGVQSGSSFTTSTNFSAGATTPMYLGTFNTTIGRYNGLMSNIRIVIGSAIIPSPVPTSPLSAVSNTTFLYQLPYYNVYRNSNSIQQTQTYPISSFTSFDGSNLLVNYPLNWQLLKLSSPFANNTQYFGLNLKTSNPNQLSLMALSTVNGIDYDRMAVLSSVRISTENRPLTRNSGVTSSTASPFGTGIDGSASFDGGSNANIRIPHQNSLNLAGYPFTIEFWLNKTSGNPTLFCKGVDSDNPGMVFNCYITSGGVLRYGISADTQVTSYTVPNGTWIHLAFVFDGIQTNTVYANGVNVLSFSGIPRNNTYDFVIGLVPGQVVYFFGSISNFRIVRGAAIYTSNFTPPTAPLDIYTDNTTIFTSVLYKSPYSTNFLTQQTNSIHIGGLLNGYNTQNITVTGVSTTFDNLYIHNRGSLIFSPLSSNTLTVYNSAGIQITSEGTLNIGTSSSVIPLSTTHIINLSNTQIDVNDGGNFNVYGFPKTVATHLVTDYPVGSRTFTTTSNISSNWKIGDLISFRPVLSSRRGFDTLVLSSFTSSNTFTTTSATLFTHTGSATNPEVAGVYNLSRNVIIQGINSTNTGTIRTTNAAKTNLNYAQLSNFGINSPNKTGFVLGNDASGNTTLSGIVINSINNIAPLTGKVFQNFSIYNSIIDRSNVLSISSLSVTNVNISNNFILSSAGNGLQITNSNGSLNMSNNTTVGSLNYGTYLLNNNLTGTIGSLNYNSGLQGLLLSASNITGIIIGGSINSAREGVYVDASVGNLSATSFQNIIASNNSSVGFRVSGNNLNYLTPITLNINGLTANNNLSAGFETYNITGNLSNITVNNNRNNGVITSIGNGPTIFDGLTSLLSGTGFTSISSLNYSQTVIKNALLSSSNLNTPSLAITANKLEEFRLENSILSANTPLSITSTRPRLEGSYIFHNSNSSAYRLSSLALTAYQTDVYKEGIVVMSENGLYDNHYKYTNAGSITLDKLEIFSNPISERLTPWSANTKLRSTSKLIPINIRESITVSVTLKTSNGYTGAAPRLVLVGNASLGYFDSVVNTTELINSWVVLSYTLPPALDTGVVELYVDCSGNIGSGYINIDSWNFN